MGGTLSPEYSVWAVREKFDSLEGAKEKTEGTGLLLFMPARKYPCFYYLYFQKAKEQIYRKLKEMN